MSIEREPDKPKNPPETPESEERDFSLPKFDQSWEGVGGIGYSEEMGELERADYDPYVD